MKCPNCNKEIDEGSAFCIFCGKPVDAKPATEEAVKVEEVVKTEEDTPIVEEKKVVEEVITDDELIVEEKPAAAPVQEEVVKQPEAEKKPEYTVAPKATSGQSAQTKKRHSIITVAILGVVMLLAIIIGIVCLSLSSSPEKVYKAMITAFSNSMIANDAITNSQANISGAVEIETDIEELEEMVNELAVSANLQYDLDTREIIAKAKIDKGSDSYLDGQIFMNILEKKMYIGEANLFDKLISIEIPEEALTQINEIWGEDEQLTVDKSVAKTAAKRFSKAINDNLLDEYFSSQKVTVNIEGKNKNVKDNALILTGEQVKTVYTNALETLKNDDKFLACYKDEEQMKDTLETLIDEIEDMEIEGTMEVHYYTSGLFNSFVGAAIVSTDEYDDQAVIEIIAADKNVYNVALKAISSGDEEELLTATVTVNKLDKDEMDVVVDLDIEDVGSITVKAAGSTIYGKDVETMDIANAVDYEDLTDDDMTEIAENLQDSALYSLIETYMDDSSDYDDDYTYDDDDTSDYDLPDGVTLEEGEGCVLTYDDDVVKFLVPSTFEEDYGGNSYRAYSKEVNYDYAEVDVDAEYATVDEYSQEIAESLDYLEDMDGYSDMTVSDIEEVEVNGVTFKKRTTSYKSTIGSYSFTYVTTYYYTKITDEYTYVVAVSDDEELMTEAELTKFLTITIE